MKKLKLISLILVVVMLVSMLPIAGMLSAFAAEDDAVANDDWYTRETTDDTPFDLDINDENDLLAFAEKLSEGTTKKPAFFHVAEDGTETQMTVHLRAHIILNDGWNCIGVEKAADVKEPAVVYPVASGAMFGGIFDGHGYVLSGLYVNGTANVGVFGNVASGYTATVKNVIIKNTFVQGNGIAIGTIFGTIEDKPWDESHTSGRFGKPTKATIDNVYVESTVSSTTEANGNLGSGGLVGGIRADMEVTDSSYVGTVFGGYRGTGAVMGSYRTKEMDTSVETVDNSNGKYHFYPNESTLLVENCYLEAHIVAGAVAKSQGGAGAIVGYVNDCAVTITTKDIVSACTFATKGLMEEKDSNGVATGRYVTEVKSSTSWGPTDAFTAHDSKNGPVIETREYYERTGYLWGFTHNAGKAGTNEVTKESGLTVWTYMTFDLTNTYYVKNLNNKIKYEGFGYSIDKAYTVFIMNGKELKTGYNAETGVTDDPTLWNFTNWDTYKAAVDLKKTDSSVKLPVLYTDIAEISYYGEPRMYNGEQQYAYEGERRAQLFLNYANDHFGLETGANEDWATTLTTQMTGLTASEWAEYGDYLLPVSVYNMVVAAGEAMDVPSATPTIDADWYANETANENTNLVIYNADDLLAFAAAINEGKNFAGMTVKLSSNVTLNAGWDAFATEVTAPTTTWPLTNPNMGFAGTFDGNGKTISGIYLNVDKSWNSKDNNNKLDDVALQTNIGVGIFGNVYSNTKAVVKDVRIDNSYVTSKTNGVGGLFGIVHGESVTAPVNTNDGYVGNTSATIDNVWATINVVGTFGNNANTDYGVGGLVGGTSSDVIITNTVFDGSVSGNIRGIGGLIGSSYPKPVWPNTNNQTSWNGSWANNGIYKNTITVSNVLLTADVIVPTAGYGFSGGVVGYGNDATTTFNITDSVIAPAIDHVSTNNGGSARSGAIFGWSWSATTAKRVEKTDDQGQPVYFTDTFEFNMNNVFCTSAPFAAAANAAWIVNVDGVKAVDNADTADVNERTKAFESLVVDAADLAILTADWANWTDANGAPLPTTVFNSFYTGFVGQSVSLGAGLEFNVYVKTDGAQKEYDGTFKFMDEEFGVISENMGNNVHKFTLTDVDPSEMGEKIEFSYGEGADKACETSVKAYLVTLLGYDAELASAMLRWGAAAQVASNYRVNALVTDGVEGLTTETDTTAGLTNDATVDGTESADWYVKGVELIFDKGVMKLKVKAYVKSLAGQQGVSIAVEGRENIIHLDYRNMTPVETETRTYTAIFTNFDMGSVNGDIMLAVLEREGADVALSQTMITDFDDLVADFMASDAAADQKALVKAMHAVSVALAD